jgi:hypothetical protein
VLLVLGPELLDTCMYSSAVWHSSTYNSVHKLSIMSQRKHAQAALTQLPRAYSVYTHAGMYTHRQAASMCERIKRLMMLYTVLDCCCLPELSQALIIWLQCFSLSCFYSDIISSCFCTFRPTVKVLQCASTRLHCYCIPLSTL